MSSGRQFLLPGFLLSLAAFGTAFILLTTSAYGVGISPDSVGYLSIARNLSEGNGYVNYRGEEVVVWPPLLPAILALVKSSVGIDPVEAARFFNAIVFGLVVALANWVILTHIRSSHKSIYAMFGVGWFLFSTPLLIVSVMAWTEPLFILLTMLFLISMSYFLRTGHLRVLLASSALAACAALTRYIGVTLIMTGLVVIIVIHRDSLRNKLSKCLLFGGLSAFPLAIWALRNWVVSDTFFGQRTPSTFSLVYNLTRTRDTLFGWFLSDELSSHFSAITRLSVLAACVIFILLLKNRKSHGAHGSLLGLLAVFIIIYTSFLIITSTTTAYDIIGNRLLSPIYVPLLWILGLILHTLVTSLERKGYRYAPAMLLVVAFLWSLFPLLQIIPEVENRVEKGAGGYAREGWVNSETMRYLSEHDLCAGLQVYSNRPDTLYILNGINAELTPRKTFYNSEKMAQSLDSLVGKWPEASPACLIWFEAGRYYLFSVGELAKATSISPIAEFEDGEVYLVTRLN